MSVAAEFKAKLRSRTPMLGVFVRIPHHMVVEALGGSGVDCICLDAEHSPFGQRELDTCLLAARAAGLPAIVRTATAAPGDIQAALDLGAAAVMVPHVCSVAQAEAVVRASAYGPGGRGYAGSLRANGFAAGDIAERLAAAAAETSVIVQVEDAAGLHAVSAIAATPGVDAIFVGQVDLTISMGETSPQAQTVETAVRQILRDGAEACPMGVYSAGPADIASRRASGASLFLVGSDLALLRGGAQRLHSFMVEG